MKPRRNLFLGSLVVIALSQAAQAATFYWDGTTGNWNDLTKWSTDLAGTTDPAAAPLATVSDILNFNTTVGNAASSTLYLNGTRGSSSILATMNFSTGSATTTTLLGGVSGTPANNDLFITTLTVNAGSGAVTIGDTAGTPTAKVNLKAGSISFTNNSSSLLTLANGLNSYGTGGTTTFTFAGSGNILSGGVIGNGTSTNVVALSKTGAGILTLSGVNTFTGGVTINGTGNGGIKITNSDSLGTHATGKTVDFNTGTNGVAELDMDPGAAGSITLSNKINFTASSNSTTGSGIVSRTGTNQIQGKITMRSGLASLAVSSSSGSTLTLSGVISANVSGRTLFLGGASTNANTISGDMNNSGGFGDFNVSKSDAGTWILSGNNSYTGLTSISAGTLKFGHANAIGGSGGFTVSGAASVDNSSGGALVMNSVGTVTLQNNLTFGGTNDLTINSAINQSADLTVTMSGAGGLTFGNYTNTAASNRILNVAGSSNGTLTFNNVAISNSSASYNLRIGNNSASNGKLNIAGVISDGGSATASSLTIGGSSAANTVTLSNANTYRGGTTLGSGTLNINNAAALGDTSGTFTINGGTIDTTAADLTTNNYSIALNGDFTFKGTNNLNLGTGAVTMGGNRQVTVSAKELSIGGVIDDGASSFGITKTGAGTLTLTGANTYNNNTSITNGTLKLNHNPTDSNPAILGNVSLSTSTNGNRPVLWLGNNNQLQSTATISATIGGSNSVFTDFVLAGRSQTIAGYTASGAPATGVNFIENGYLAGDTGTGILTINNSSTVTLGGGTGANRLTIRDNNATGGGTLALVKDGAGTLVFNLNAANYTGGFTIKNGITQIAGTAFADTGTVSTSTPLTLEGGTLSSNGGTARAVGAGNTVSLAGDVTLGDVTNNGALSFAGAATLTGNRNLSIASDVTFSGAIGQDVAGRTLTKLGTGTLFLSNSNTYSGGTTIKAGTLDIGSSATAGGAGDIFIGDNSGSSTATLQVHNNLTFANAITVQGNGGIKSINSTTSAATPVFSGGVTLNDNLTLNNNAASSNLQFTTNAFALNGKMLTVNSNGSNAGTVTFASTAPITGTSASAINFGGTTAGAGKFRLNAANTFSGTATINASSGGGALALELNHANAMQNATLDTGSSGNQAVTFILTGTTYNIGALTGSDDIDITGSNTISVGGKAVDTVFSGVIGNSSGSGSLTKVGGNTLTLTNTNNYSGATQVNGGKLLINGNISTSTTTVNNTGTLGGNGTTGTVFVESGGKLAPGNSIDSLTASGNVNLASGSIFEVEIDTATSYDTLGINLGGDLNVTSGAKLSLLDFGSASLIALNSRLQLIDYTGGTWNTGLFTLGTEELSDSETFTWASNTWLINYDDTLGAGDTTLSNGGYYVTLTAIPEPRAAILGLLGTLALLRRRR